MLRCGPESKDNKMANMSYCRFQNTVADLSDCYDHMEDELSDDEEKARQRLIKLCTQILWDYGETD